MVAEEHTGGSDGGSDGGVDGGWRSRLEALREELIGQGPELAWVRQRITDILSESPAAPVRQEVKAFAPVPLEGLDWLEAVAARCRAAMSVSSDTPTQIGSALKDISMLITAVRDAEQELARIKKRAMCLRLEDALKFLDSDIQKSLRNFELVAALQGEVEALKRQLSGPPAAPAGQTPREWQCGCGAWNGVNLAQCGGCTRPRCEAEVR